MLSRKDSEQIRRHGVATLHDHWFNSLFAGEPFFEDGRLAYFDGRAVTLCGFPLRGGPALGAAKLCRAAVRWAVERHAEVVSFVGPRPLDLGVMKSLGYRRVCEDHGAVFSAELLIDCNDGERAGRRRRSYRRARAAGLRAKVRLGGLVTAEHLGLIEQFYRLRDLSPYLANMAFATPALVRARRVHLIEAWHGGELCGFMVLHKAFADIVTALLLFHDHQTTGVSDFLYGEMLADAQRLGATYVNVGPSPTIGHYNFKRKWGGKPLVPPYYSVVWARGHIARRWHISWGPRLVRL